MIDLPKHKQLVLFDGVCNLCDSGVQYIIKHDKKDVFMFTALQSETGKQIIKQFNIDSYKMDSILLYAPEKGISYKSSAALKIALKLGFPLNLLGVFLIIPICIRNWVYDFIAKNRYKWYGKKEACMVPSQKVRNKFLN